MIRFSWCLQPLPCPPSTLLLTVDMLIIFVFIHNLCTETLVFIRFSLAIAKKTYNFPFFSAPPPRFSPAPRPLSFSSLRSARLHHTLTALLLLLTTAACEKSLGPKHKISSLHLVSTLTLHTLTQSPNTSNQTLIHNSAQKLATITLLPLQTLPVGRSNTNILPPHTHPRAQTKQARFFRVDGYR